MTKNASPNAKYRKYRGKGSESYFWFSKSCGKWQRVENSFRNVQQIEKCKIHTIHFWCFYRDNNNACNAWDTAMYLAIHIKSSVQEIIRLDVLIHLDTLSESYGFVSAIHLPLEYIMNSLLGSHYKDKQKHLDFLSAQLYELLQ